MYCIKNIEYHTTKPKLSLSTTPNLALTIEAAESLSCDVENTKSYSMKYHWYQLNLSLNSGYIGIVKVFSKLIQDGPWVFVDAFISSILQAALVFHDFSCSLYQSGPVCNTLIATRVDTKAEPLTGRTLIESCHLQVLKNKVNSHMWHLQLSKIVVLCKEKFESFVQSPQAMAMRAQSRLVDITVGY
jgi:hypothetical protein